MKKSFVLITNVTPGGSEKSPSESPKTPAESFIMTGGKVFQEKDGQRTQVHIDVVISGTRISSSGKVTLQDDSIHNLNEGDRVDSLGNILRKAPDSREGSSGGEMHN